MRVDELVAFIEARHSIYLKREAGEPKPWTTDKILQSYRFCNMYRELDTVTQWVATHWREPNTNDPDLWFAMTLARLVNLPDCLQAIEYPVPWNPERFLRVMHQRQGAGKKTFNSAYIVSTNGKAMNKADYLEEYVLTPLWENHVGIRPNKGNTLAVFANRLNSFNGMGTFMTGQVVADVKYAAGSPLQTASDWWTWAAPGPGSKRGLNRVYDRLMDSPWPKTRGEDREWLLALLKLRDMVNPIIEKLGYPRLHAQDLQNCLCEFDKYERVRLGEGRPKSTYPGGR